MPDKNPPLLCGTTLVTVKISLALSKSIAVDHAHPTLIVAARANHTIRNGHVKLCFYIPNTCTALIEYIKTLGVEDSSTDTEDTHDFKRKKTCLRPMEKGVFLDINIQAGTLREGLLSILLPGIQAEITSEDGLGLIRAFAAMPVDEIEIREMLKVIFGQKHDYHLISTILHGNNCVTLLNRALKEAGIFLGALLGLEHLGIQRPQDVANAIATIVQQASDTSYLDTPQENTITFAQYDAESLLGRPLWCGHTQGHKHLPMHEVVKLLETCGLLYEIGSHAIHVLTPTADKRSNTVQR